MKISSSAKPKERGKVKRDGQVYTPDYIVENILDLVGYDNDIILQKHVIDNSCGDGAFLIEVVRRYIHQAKSRGFTVDEIRRQLGEYIHGIELDETECTECVSNLTLVADSFGIAGVSWDIRCQDTTSCNSFDGKMDYVVGNPPYVRIHNIGRRDLVKKFGFAQSGMTDLYLVFFEIGLRMLNQNGVLGYISPSSYFNSSAGLAMRKYLVDEQYLKTVVDLKHFQAFTATTYTAITVLKKGSRGVDYYEYDKKKKTPKFVCNLLPEDYFLDEKYYFSSKNDLRFLSKVISNTKKYCNVAKVKNGFATLADGVFISDDFSFNDYIIPVVKSSTGERKKCFFPYLDNKLIAYDRVSRNRKVREFLAENESALRNRSITDEKMWYGFGRTQAINDVYKNKYAISCLVRDVEDIKIVKCGVGVGVYGGLYILSDLPFEKMKALIKNDGFVQYVRLLGKYKSGGYYTFSSKDVEKYLYFELSEADND